MGKLNEANKSWLDKPYITARDINENIPNITIEEARNIINLGIDKMKKKNLLIPRTKQKMALARIIKEMMGL